jgi:hypothetical protein
MPPQRFRRDRSLVDGPVARVLLPSTVEQVVAADRRSPLAGVIAVGPRPMPMSGSLAAACTTSFRRRVDRVNGVRCGTGCALRSRRFMADGGDGLQ